MVISGSGASCNSNLRSPFINAGPPAPQVISPAATAAEVVAAVNQNTSRVRTYSTNNASIRLLGMPGLPALSGNIAAEMPSRFRLRAGTTFTGGEVDLGSNEELYWMWSKRNDPPGVYFARHAQHAGSAAAQMLPIEPAWLSDALGLVQLDPNVAYVGPTPRADGSLELRSQSQGPTGLIERVVVVDPTYAWVKEQHVYDGVGSLLASAVAEDFRYDPVAQVSLPRRVTINIPRADVSLAIDTGSPAVNVPLGDPQQLWALPQVAGTPQIDLGNSAGIPAGVSALNNPGQFRQPTTQQHPMSAGSVALQEQQPPLTTTPQFVPGSYQTEPLSPTQTAIPAFPASAYQSQAPSQAPFQQQAIQKQLPQQQPQSFSQPIALPPIQPNASQGLPTGGVMIAP